MSGGTCLFVIVAPDDTPIYEAEFPEAKAQRVRAWRLFRISLLGG